MAKLSEKYIAGFLDADGSIQILWRRVDRADSNPQIKRPYLSLEWSQKACQDEVLRRIQECLGGAIYKDSRGDYLTLKIFGREAIAALNRIRKYLVIKRHYANVVLDILGKPRMMDETKAFLKDQRKIKSLPLPNFPPRKWLAGYFDGDGSIQVRTPQKRTSAQIAVQFVASDFDSEGIEIIQKNFGGSLHYRYPNGNRLVFFTMTMPPSKTKQFFEYFAKHMIIKREQAEFVLGCASMGHYQDGRRIKEVITQLKSHPHRLNEPKADISVLLKTVNPERTVPGPDFKQRRISLKRQSICN